MFSKIYLKQNNDSNWGNFTKSPPEEVWTIIFAPTVTANPVEATIQNKLVDQKYTIKIVRGPTWRYHKCTLNHEYARITTIHKASTYEILNHNTAECPDCTYEVSADSVTIEHAIREGGRRNIWNSNGIYKQKLAQKKDYQNQRNECFYRSLIVATNPSGYTDDELAHAKRTYFNSYVAKNALGIIAPYLHIDTRTVRKEENSDLLAEEAVQLLPQYLSLSKYNKEQLHTIAGIYSDTTVREGVVINFFYPTGRNPTYYPKEVTNATKILLLTNSKNVHFDPIGTFDLARLHDNILGEDFKNDDFTMANLSEKLRQFGHSKELHENILAGIARYNPETRKCANITNAKHCLVSEQYFTYVQDYHARHPISDCLYSAVDLNTAKASAIQYRATKKLIDLHVHICKSCHLPSTHEHQHNPATGHSQYDKQCAWPGCSDYNPNDPTL